MTLPELDDADRAYAKLFGVSILFILVALVVGASFVPAPHAKHHSSPTVIHPRTTWNV